MGLSGPLSRAVLGVTPAGPEPAGPIETVKDLKGRP